MTLSLTSLSVSQIPGVTTPLHHLPILLGALLATQIFHELGHALAAALYVHLAAPKSDYRMTNRPTTATPYRLPLPVSVLLFSSHRPSSRSLSNRPNPFLLVLV